MLILRTIKGAKLTWTELDGNFTYLEDEIEVVRELADGDTLVRITPQVFLPEQKDQALANIGAAPQSVINDIEARVEFLETIQPVTYDLQTPTPGMQQQLRDNAGVYSKGEINDLLAGVVTPKQKNIIVHTLSSADLELATITLYLDHVVDTVEFYDLHINGVYINDDDYMVDQHKIIIARSNIDYELMPGMKLTFRYRY